MVGVAVGQAGLAESFQGAGFLQRHCYVTGDGQCRAVVVACLVAVAGAAGQLAEAVQDHGLADPDAEVAGLFKGLGQAVQRGVEVACKLEGQSEVVEGGRLERAVLLLAVDRQGAAQACD